MAGDARNDSPKTGGSPLTADRGFELLFEHSDQMVCTLDLGGRFTSVNPAGERLTGYSAAELVGRLATDLIAPEHRAEAVEQFQRRLSGDSSYAPDESVLVTRTGKWVPIEVTSSLLALNGAPVGVLGLVRDISARKTVETALSESEERFRSAFTFAAIGMAMVAPDGRFLQVNDALCEIVGYSAEELLDKTFQDITHPDDLEADLGFVRQMLAGEIRTYQMEKRYFDKDGRVVWILLSVSLVRAIDGSPLHFISQIQDITEQREAQQAIEESEARLAEAQRVARIGSWERTLSTDESAWSDEMYRIFGVDPDAGPLGYERLLDLVHPEDRPAVLATRARAKGGDDRFGVEYRVVHPDATIKWIHSRGDVVAVDGAPVAMVGTAQDITERKAAEQALADAELRYRTLVEQLPLAMYIRPLDISQANLYCSPQVEPILGYSAAEWETNPDLLVAIVHPDDRDLVISAGEHTRATGEPLHLEYRYLHRDGHVVWVQDETYVVNDERGRPLCVQGYLLDITTRKRAEEERDRLRDDLHHAQKLEALGRLAGGVAHDFNNVLTAIKGYAELALSDLAVGSPARKEVEQISRAAEQASTLPQQLLAFGRKQVLRPTVIDLDEAVADACELVRMLVRESIELVVVREATRAMVLADPSQLEQVLLNLAVNARDAMVDGGTLTIATETEAVTAGRAAEYEVEPGEYAVITVSDTGHGMVPETMARVFEPFFTTKQRGQGSGLGLATAYGTVRQSGGFIEVESEPEKGTTFAIYLPCAEASELSASAPVSEPSVTPDPTTVLLVEDEEMVRDVAKTSLERAGYRVLTAACADDAFEAWTRSGIDVLVTDMVMPGMGGRELADRVVHLEPSVPVVFMSGYTDEPPVIELNGATTSFLAKPFAPTMLVEAVQGVLDDARARVSSASRKRPRTDSKGFVPAERKSITCVIADDHPAVLDSISRFLEDRGFDVLARVSRADDALAELEAQRPAIALLDVSMEPFSGVEVARKAATLSPKSRVVLFTGLNDRGLLDRALEAGVSGFVLKSTPLPELARALEVVADGGTYVDPELASAVAVAATRGDVATLTPRESEILGLLAEGMTNEKAADLLGISPETVQSHVHNAMGKLEADTRTQAVATAIRHSLIG